MPDSDFFTFSEYLRKDQEQLSPSAQDYMEMIYRLSQNLGFTRVNDLAQALNVQPSSVTKMIQKLSEMNLIKYERYGVIMLKEDGIKLGKALLYRHNLIEEFLRLLSITDGILSETEKMEHTISNDILSGLNDLVDFFYENPDVLRQWQLYRKKKKKS
ncbi:DtxR family iron (metal) dependent repressor [Herbinix hemicellulosilytica]|uniref:Manganese transport regulator n=1 Tax=Herbinix hemicellulosilytica TaxID=1564487 RepID=A0A0H5SFA0_HERHM|nr:transcriptional regulator MntR [Herbinix hemicellulosilytica]RBP57679.1 DtxR family iron (metal) dependent repressor [Herbinix hemicellulosilytica]CRZ34162.1 hypothetical protein HHT355_0959 [Herbinix hemicellulosilytica]